MSRLWGGLLKEARAIASRLPALIHRSQSMSPPRRGRGAEGKWHNCVWPILPARCRDDFKSNPRLAIFRVTDGRFLRTLFG